MPQRPNVALITGITGQDGATLAHFLLGKDYVVHGIIRRSSSSNTSRLQTLGLDHGRYEGRFYLHFGDITDGLGLARLIDQIRPHEIYNLAAQSHVGISFETAEYTANTGALGPLRMLEAMRLVDKENRMRFFQASTSELYGRVDQVPLTEKTPFQPRSPYAIAKLYAYWITINYREAYGMHASNGILFNHEGPLRGDSFVTRKISRVVAAIARGKPETLTLGNLDAQRDWGHARDFVEGIWMMLQQPQPDDYLLATGEMRSVRDFVETAFRHIGIKISWRNKGQEEFGLEERTGRIWVRVDPNLYRPTEVDRLCGDYSKAKSVLGWKPKHTFSQLVAEMVDTDIGAEGV